MAKVIQQMTGERLNRRPSFKDSFYIREWRGKQIAQAKPIRKRGPLSPAQQRAVDLFKQAAVMVKECAPSQQIEADELSRGTQYFARDILFMAMYGTLAHVQLDDGRKLFSVAANSNVSDLLDAIAQAVGEMMYRAPDGWERVPAGNNGEVLTLQEGAPRWLPASGGGGGGAFAGCTYVNNGVSTESGAGATIGLIVQPKQTVLVTSICATTSRLDDFATFNASIGRKAAFDETSAVTEILAQTPTQGLTRSGYSTLEFPFAEPVELLAGVPYILLCSRNDSTTTESYRGIYPSSVASAQYLNGPFDFLDGRMRFNTTDPAVSMPSPNTIGSRPYFLWPNGRFAE